MRWTRWHVSFVPTTDMSIGAARPAAKDRRGATRSWRLLPYYSRSTRWFPRAVEVCMPLLSARTSRYALPPFRLGRKKARQERRAPDIGADGERVHAVANKKNSGGPAYV